MDTLSLITIILLAAGAIVSLFFGIKLLIKYNQTRKKLYLFLGILLTFIVPAILLFLAFNFWRMSTTMIYGPGPIVAYGPNPMIEYGPGPV